MTGPTSSRADTAVSARRWIEAWDRGWRASDPDPIVALYAPDAVFLTHPFRAPATPRDYIAQAFADAALVEGPRWAEPLVAGERAAVEYWAILRARSGAALTISGVTVLRFRPDGLAAEHRDYWALDEGRFEPNWLRR